MTKITYNDDRVPPRGQVLELYRANAWSSADKPEALMAALQGSDYLVSAWCGDRLLGLGNAISDGHLVVYYPHLLVHPEFQNRGIGMELIQRLRRPYADFHQHMITADKAALGFYRKAGFVRAGETEAMWIYDGDDH